MKITRLSSREFNQDVGRAKRAADKGPVIITDRGAPAYVLLKHEAYKRISGKEKSILELLHHPGVEDIELDIPPRRDSTFRPIDLS
ncbi:MAG: type II toxin-antitoxin system prevent-host-death family antitoxin [Rhodospirillaceae bacterium]|nr:type II toxin-antitoxin system prevent-host-death family antitoxin [Rhodospirillaceae bacterium]